MKTTSPWRVRAIQLDLARQRETLGAVGDFMGFARDWGYNTLVLYLEGMVRTKSFPHRPAARTYSTDDMRRVVEMGAQAKLEVVPSLATLAHVEQFTTCRQLYSLREDASRAPHMFCPSNPRVYEFLERYLSEIAALFPSRNFHIGCDEAWGLGICPACRRQSSEQLLLGHVQRVRAILRPLGKRIWIADDMFENSPISTLRALPRDIVMVAWNYSPEQMNRDGLQGHFNNRDRRDWLAIYDRLGLDALISPWAGEFENTLAFTDLARRHPVLGGLQTNWELSTAFLPSVLPGSALAGALWSQPNRDPKQVAAATLRRLFPSLIATERIVVRATLIQPLLGMGLPVTGHLPVAAHLRGPLTLEESRYLHSQLAHELILAAALRRLRGGRERDMLEELHLLVRLQIVAGREREGLPRLIDPRIDWADRQSALRQARWCVRELQSLARRRAAQWRRYRPGIEPDHASAVLRERAAELRAFVRGARSINLLLQVRLFLWDSYSAPQLRIELGNAGKWRVVYRGNFKPVNQRDAQYTLQVPVRWTGRLPARARFTVSGFGGQGISFAAVHFAGGSLVPTAFTRRRGEIVDPRAVLKDDSTVCYLGSPDTVSTLREHSDGKESAIEISFRRARV